MSIRRVNWMFCAVHVCTNAGRRSVFEVVAFSTLLEHVVTCAYAWGVWHVAWNRIAMPFSFLSSLSQLPTIECNFSVCCSACKYAWTSGWRAQPVRATINRWRHISSSTPNRSHPGNDDILLLSLMIRWFSARKTNKKSLTKLWMKKKKKNKNWTL